MIPEANKMSKKLLFALFALQLLTAIKLFADQNVVDQLTNFLDITTNSEPSAKIIKSPIGTAKKIKDWTLILYISADNDLRNFAIRNIKQMAKIGSNQYINIVVHLDIKISGNKKVTRRYYVEKDKILHVNANDPHSQRMDSGNPETLISCCKWAKNIFPAKHYGLILWNHGTGAIDPKRGRIIKLSELFNFNPETNKVELDRSVGFLDLMNASLQEDRGICWDDTTGNYLTNQDLDYALKIICFDVLNGKKLAFIGFDACLMQMIEVANITKKYADIMIGSQEVILGTGWHYIETLKPFLRGTLSPEEFAKHIVASYKKAYSKITNDFTLAAINLNKFELLEKTIHNISQLLIQCLKSQKNNSVKNTISKSRSKFLCTHFDEPSFIDLHHFLTNLLLTTKNFKLKTNDKTKLKKQLKQELEIGRMLLTELIIASASGKNLSKAKGMSIYFPTRRIYHSYRKLPFAKENNWILFLTQYLNI